jgi:hypothetical protein
MHSPTRHLVPTYSRFSSPWFLLPHFPVSDVAIVRVGPLSAGFHLWVRDGNADFRGDLDESDNLRTKLAITRAACRSISSESRLQNSGLEQRGNRTGSRGIHQVAVSCPLTITPPQGLNTGTTINPAF